MRNELKYVRAQYTINGKHNKTRIHFLFHLLGTNKAKNAMQTIKPALLWKNKEERIKDKPNKRENNELGDFETMAKPKNTIAIANETRA